MFQVIMTLFNRCVGDRLDNYSVKTIKPNQEWEVELETSYFHPILGMKPKKPKKFRITSPGETTRDVMIAEVL